MPRSFLVRMRQSTEDTRERGRDTPHDSSESLFQSPTTLEKPSEFQQQILCHREVLQINHVKLLERSRHQNLGVQLATLNNAYFHGHYYQPATIDKPAVVTSQVRHTSGLGVTSHNPHVCAMWPTYGWLPTHGSVYYHSPLAPPRCAQLPRQRQGTWGYPEPTGYSMEKIQRSLLTDGPRAQKQSSQKDAELPKPPLNDNQSRQERDRWRLTPGINEFFSMQEAAQSKLSNQRNEGTTDTNLEKSSQEKSDSSGEIGTMALKKDGKKEERRRSSDAHAINKDMVTMSAGDTERSAEKTPKNAGQGNMLQQDATKAVKAFNRRECGKEFGKLSSFTRHQATHNSKKTHECSKCNKAFNRASNLQAHMKTHTDYKPYKCDYCGKGFHQKIDKRIHHYTHTGEKPHKCQKCGRGFKQLTHLNYHMRTHSDQRIYQCTYCGKGFNQKGNLQAHIYGHTGERPFQCGVCGKGFTLRSTLNTHLRTHAPKKPFVCEYCDKAFYQKNALKMHHIASHPIVNGKSIL